VEYYWRKKFGEKYNEGKYIYLTTNEKTQ